VKQELSGANRDLAAGQQTIDEAHARAVRENKAAQDTGVLSLGVPDTKAGSVWNSRKDNFDLTRGEIQQIHGGAAPKLGDQIQNSREELTRLQGAGAPDADISRERQHLASLEATAHAEEKKLDRLLTRAEHGSPVTALDGQDKRGWGFTGEAVSAAELRTLREDLHPVPHVQPQQSAAANFHDAVAASLLAPSPGAAQPAVALGGDGASSGHVSAANFHDAGAASGPAPSAAAHGPAHTEATAHPSAPPSSPGEGHSAGAFVPDVAPAAHGPTHAEPAAHPSALASSPVDGHPAGGFIADTPPVAHGSAHLDPPAAAPAEHVAGAADLQPQHHTGGTVELDQHHIAPPADPPHQAAAAPEAPPAHQPAGAGDLNLNQAPQVAEAPQPQPDSIKPAAAPRKPVIIDTSSPGLPTAPAGFGKPSGPGAKDFKGN